MNDAPITFVIAGQPRTARGTGGPPLQARGGLPGTVKVSVRVGARRAAGESIRVEAVPGEDVVVLHLANGPALMLHPETARDLLLGQTPARRGAGAPGEVQVPAQLRWAGLEQAAPARTRGFLGDVWLHAVEVLTGLGAEPAGRFVASRVVAAVDGQVDAGVYALTPEALSPLKGSGRRLDAVPAATEPMLVLLHGSFVDTARTFGKLWALHPGAVRTLFTHYGGRVYALDHPTLGTGPIANALTLAQALPAGARLHLVSHSRGGLVAEVLARACACGGTVPADDLAGFAAHTGERDALQALAALVHTRRIRVERIVRVACPARGTLLASRRLDAYLSVFRWTLELAGVPLAPALLDLLTAVARRREDPAQLPGLAAMLPDSALVRWLNRGDAAVTGDLRVVAGDIEGDSLGSWVKTLLADAFYWTDNDLVVQTRSMYGGAPRRGGASFLLDQGGKVTHFGYFANERSVAAIVAGLVHERPAGFRPIGPLSWAGEDAGGLRAARRSDGPPHAQPAVFVLPGILGTHLKQGDERIWLSPRLIGGLDRLAWHDGAADDVRPDGPIGMFYDALIAHLGATHEVIPFGFDWRRPIEDEARRLADAVTAALDARDASALPVRIVAHSMGGLLARTLQLERPEVWQRLMARDGAHLLMLGTPNAGSWAPMQVLSGDDTFGNTLVAFGLPFQDHAARQLMAGMPGFLQLQAGLLDPAQALAQESTWRRLADDDLQRVRDASWWHRNVFGGDGDDLQLIAYAWGVPPQAVLDRAVALRQRLDAQRDAVLPAFAKRILLVTGHARFTPDGWEWSNEGLLYRDATDGGDGRVTLASAMLPGVRTWTLDVEHGSLPDTETAFDAFVELLEQGDTHRLPRLAETAAVRGPGAGALAAPAVHVRNRPARGRLSGAEPATSMKDLLRTSLPAEAPRAAGTALRVTVLNGDLKFVPHPLMLGHYRSSELSGTEWVVDRMVGGTMLASLEAGLYPEPPGTHQIFQNTRQDPDNPWRAPRPAAVIVVGLGSEGDLTVRQLTTTVRQGVLAWAQRLTENAAGAAGVSDLAATLIGSGGLGIAPGAAACAIAQGVREANERLAASGWPVIGHLWLVELFLERAADAWRQLQVQATATPGRYDIAPHIATGTGPLRRQLDTAYRGADYDLITAETQADPGGDHQGRIAYRLDTRRARTEVRAQMTQARLVRSLVTQAANDANTDPQIGRTLFQLLVPPEVEPFLGGTDQMLLELDGGTAGIPWELLDTPPEERAGGDRRPWAIRSKLLRKLRSTEFRAIVHDAEAEDHVLVIGEPKLDDPRYPALPGSLAEARAVAETFAGADGIGAERVTALIGGADASTILNALLARRYRIVHIAGHGEPGELGGVVMSDNTVLGPREIQTMRTVPELVFVNCCHLAARDERQLLAPLDRAAFAAGVAEALIRIGVRCVIAAGWAVEDEPAKCFATVLYRELLAGRSFVDATATAREEAWQGADGGNTWAAYQCYGDPHWSLRRGTADAQVARSALLAEYANISSPLGLALALEELAVRSRYQDADAASQREKIRHLEARFAGVWAGMGALGEAFGLAYAEAGDLDAAIDAYARAAACNDGSASMKGAEQLAHLRVRRAWAQAAAGDAAQRRRCRAEIEGALQQLDALASWQPTAERHSLRGSAWNRLAMLDTLEGADTTAALAQMQASYQAADEIATAAQSIDAFYPALKLLSAQTAAHAFGGAAPPPDPALRERVRQGLRARLASEPDFWSMVGVIELDLMEALAERRLADVATDLLARFDELKRRVKAPRLWGSVADNAHFLLAARRTEAAAPAEADAATQLLEVLQRYAGD